MPLAAALTICVVLSLALLLSFAPVAHAASPDLEDGTYTCDVALGGGSGRAGITSPAVITVEGGNAVATIEWSSSNYDYMVVDGITYYTVNDTGNSTFEIPVTTWDEPMPVVADTTAMSSPHEIEYTLTFDSVTLAPEVQEGAATGDAAGTLPESTQSSSLSSSAIIVIVVVAVAVVVCIVIIAVRRSKKNGA